MTFCGIDPGFGSQIHEPRPEALQVLATKLEPSGMNVVSPPVGPEKHQSHVGVVRGSISGALEIKLFPFGPMIQVGVTDAAAAAFTANQAAVSSVPQAKALALEVAVAVPEQLAVVELTTVRVPSGAVLRRVVLSIPRQLLLLSRDARKLAVADVTTTGFAAFVQPASYTTRQSATTPLSFAKIAFSLAAGLPPPPLVSNHVPDVPSYRNETKLFWLAVSAGVGIGTLEGQVTVNVDGLMNKLMFAPPNTLLNASVALAVNVSLKVHDGLGDAPPWPHVPTSTVATPLTGVMMVCA